MKVSHMGIEENEPRLISVGKPQPIEEPFEDKTVRVHKG